MRILNRKQFMALKHVCVFAKYRPVFYEALGIKIIWDSPSDFAYQDLDPIGALLSDGSEDTFLKLDAMAKDSKIDNAVDFHQYGRDGFFDTDQLFVVFSDEDVMKLIDRLREVLETKGIR